MIYGKGGFFYRWKFIDHEEREKVYYHVNNSRMNNNLNSQEIQIHNQVLTKHYPRVVALAFCNPVEVVVSPVAH